MPTYKLTYFDTDGGRGEPARITLHAGGIPFEDERLSFAEFSKMRATTPFNALPVLWIDGAPVSQSNAINSYVGKLAGLYPENPMQALYCDEAMGASEDLGLHIGLTFGLEGTALKEAREKLVEGRLSTHLRGLNSLLERRGGEYFSDGRLTGADIKVALQVRSVKRGMLDHVPADLVDRIAPALSNHYERVVNGPVVTAYYASRPRK